MSLKNSNKIKILQFGGFGFAAYSKKHPAKTPNAICIPNRPGSSMKSYRGPVGSECNTRNGFSLFPD